MTTQIKPEELDQYPGLAAAKLLSALYRRDILSGNSKVRGMLADEGMSRAEMMAILEAAVTLRAEISASAPLASPLTPDEARARADINGRISGIVLADLSLFIGNDLEAVMDKLGAKLVRDGETLEALSFDIVASRGNALLVRVSGDASYILRMLDEQEEAEREEAADAEMAGTRYIPDLDDVDFGDDEDPGPDVPHGMTAHDPLLEALNEDDDLDEGEIDDDEEDE